MTDKIELSLSKSRTSNKMEILNLLISPIKENLKTSKTALLYGLGSPRYRTNLKELYPNLEVYVVEDRCSKHKLKEDDFTKFVNITKDHLWPEEYLSMNFDCIIMNPPYGGDLHLQILQEALKHADNVASLGPVTWLKKSMICKPMGKWRKILMGPFLNSGKINGNLLTGIDILDHRTSNDLFGLGNAIEELGIFYMKKDRNFIDLRTYGFKGRDDPELHLYNDIDIGRLTETFNASCSGGKNGWRRSYWEKADKEKRGDFRRPNDVPVYGWHKADNCYDGVVDLREGKDPYQVLYFDSAEERQNFLDSLNTKFMNWYFDNYVAPGDYKEAIYMWRIPKDYVNPRTGKRGYKGEWTDEDFYKFFNLTPEEIKIIEDTMEKYK